MRPLMENHIDEGILETPAGNRTHPLLNFAHSFGLLCLVSEGYSPFVENEHCRLSVVAEKVWSPQ